MIIHKELLNELETLRYHNKRALSYSEDNHENIREVIGDVEDNERALSCMRKELESRIEDLEHEAKYGSIPTVAIPIGRTGDARVVTINDMDMSVKVLEEQMLIRKRQEETVKSLIKELKDRINDAKYQFVRCENKVTYLERDTAVNREALKLIPAGVRPDLKVADDIAYRRLHPEVFDDEDC